MSTNTLTQIPQTIGKVHLDDRVVSSFLLFLKFDDDFRLHQLPGAVGQRAIKKIEEMLQKRFMRIINSITPHLVLEEIEKGFLEIKIRAEAQIGFDNGEVLLKVNGMVVEESFILKLLTILKKSLEEESLDIDCQMTKANHQVVFSGWGYKL
ncbi:MAG TPA: hypothetical protein ENN31_01955 [Candidatus Vogelbacteria bacterium]|nr:hypothetical protein [Candidatus Vogelbacteria bacterium]